MWPFNEQRIKDAFKRGFQQGFRIAREQKINPPVVNEENEWTNAIDLLKESREQKTATEILEVVQRLEKKLEDKSTQTRWQ